MREILLTQGKIALINDDDFALVSEHSWCFRKGYAKSKIGGDTVYLHRFIMDAKRGTQVDHANGNGLDNQKENLRMCNTAENIHNSTTPKHNTSGFKGVSLCKVTKKYKAYIKISGKQVWLGYFNKPEDAADAYDEAAVKHFGKFARTNKMMREVPA